MVPHLALFTNKEVSQGEELCFDYGDSNREASVVKNEKGLREDERRTIPRRTKCVCKSNLCNGFLPFDPELL